MPQDEPTPPVGNLDVNLITPGVVGFSVTLVFIIVVILLLVNMTRRIRRLNYRAEIAQRLDAETPEATP